ncbi:MAG: type III PLP-dependent enzyme, partial [archaeon]
MVTDSATRSILDYMTFDEFQNVKDFAKDKDTPFLIIDLRKIEAKYNELRRNLPYARVHYAVKANPHPEIIKLLADKGSSFDVATIFELDKLLGLGVT